MMGGGGWMLKPPLKAEGSLRPDTRVNPRCAVSLLSAPRFWCLKAPETAAAKGASPARSAIPGPPELDGASRLGELIGPCGKAWCRAIPCLRYHLIASIAMRTTTASPAAPPTTPPAIVPAGGVLLLVEFEFEVGSVLVGAANEVELYWLGLPLSVSMVVIDVTVCCPPLNNEPERDPDGDTKLEIIDASLDTVVDAAGMVKVLPSKVVV